MINSRIKELVEANYSFRAQEIEQALKKLCEDFDTILDLLAYFAKTEPQLVEDAVAPIIARMLESFTQKSWLPEEVFRALLDKVVFVSVDVCIWRTTTSGKPEIYLTLRPLKDPDYPGKWHVPGKMVGTEDIPKCATGLSKNLLIKVARKVLKEETPELLFHPKEEPILVGFGLIFDGRGFVLKVVFMIEGNVLPNEGEAGQFFSFRDLPEDTVPEQLESIKAAYSKISGTNYRFPCD